MARARTSDFPLGRREPTDWKHVELFPFAALKPLTVDTVERTLTLPGWRVSHDQGHEGSCVGHGIVLERSITNAAQKRDHGMKPFSRYDPIAVWRGAKGIDEWPSTKPDDDQGTSVRAGYEWTRTVGLSRVTSMTLTNGVPVPVGAQPADPFEGVDTYRWATSVDEIRTAIANGVPVTIGIRWYTAFDTPIRRPSSYTLAKFGVDQLGTVRGGHCVCLYGASDKRQAFRLANSWGRKYPLVWIPYATVEFLLGADGEAALVTDR